MTNVKSTEVVFPKVNKAKVRTTKNGLKIKLPEKSAVIIKIN